MYGEEELKGIKTLKLIKSSITLPEFTKAEYNERLYYFLLNDELRLYSEKNIKVVLDTLLENIKNKMTYKEYLKYHRMIFAKLISEEKVTKNGKIKLPQNFVDKILEPSLIFVGYNTHSKIFTSIKEYEKFESKKV